MRDAWGFSKLILDFLIDRPWDGRHVLEWWMRLKRVLGWEFL